jgi:multidrug efflux pump subunit AcrA (membrane-fusion protein)
MDTEVDVPNPNLVLIPGMYAEVSLTLDHRNAVVTAPVSAVDVGTDEGSGQVVVVTPENRIEMRKVQLGMQTETKFEVKSGLHQGELVVTGNRATLKSGQEVRPKVVDLTATPPS